MIFDTDVVIAVERGNEHAAGAINADDAPQVSLQTYMELLQGARSRRHMEQLEGFLRALRFEVLPLTESIGQRAATYIREFAHSHGLRAGDALVAATAAEHELTLCTANAKHFRAIKEIELKVFRP